MTETAPAADGLRAVPSNPDAERAVLSCVLQWSDECFEPVEEHAANPAELFYNPGHRLVWNAIERLHRKAQSIDLVTVSTELGNSGDLEKIGGPMALSDLLDDVPTKALLPEYLNFLSESLQRRRIISAGSTLIGEAYDASASLESAALAFSGVINTFLEGDSQNSSKIRPMREVMKESIEMLQDAYENKGKLPGISTGFSDLDEVTNGWADGKIHVVAARPGGGKTAIGFQFILNAAKSGVNCGVFSAEMFAKELGVRGISSDANIDSLILSRGEMEHGHFKKVQASAVKLSNLPIWFDDRANMSIRDIIAGCRKMVRENDVKLILVDYLQFIREPEGSRSRVDAVTKLSAELTSLAKETGVAMIVLAQLNRASESRNDRKPIAADLRDSGAIEQDAFGIILLHEKEPADDESPSSLTDVDLIVAKWRGGQLGPIPVLFDKPVSTFKAKYQS